MRHLTLPLAVTAALAASGCAATRPDATGGTDPATVEVTRLMLAADPAQAVAYFRAKAAAAPDDATYARALAESLTRAGRTEEATLAWTKLAEDRDATPADAVGLAGALIRGGRVDEAGAVLDAVPPDHATYDRYRFEAVVADHAGDWARADSFYESAATLTDAPAKVYNNWGFSKLSRGDHAAAERLFIEAITYDAALFTAKNNLVLARAERGDYALPAVPATEAEQAQMMHTAARAALRRGDEVVARAMLERAVETHPRHFEAAARALAALDA